MMQPTAPQPLATDRPEVVVPDPTALRRMLADYTDWLAFLSQANRRSEDLRNRLAGFGRLHPLYWLLTQFLSYHVQKRQRLLGLTEDLLRQSQTVLQQVLTGVDIPPARLTQLMQAHPYTQLFMADVIRDVNRINAQYTHFP